MNLAHVTLAGVVRVAGKNRHIKRGLPAAGILFYSLWKCVKVFLLIF
jgi:hypothetical protein